MKHLAHYCWSAFLVPRASAVNRGSVKGLVDKGRSSEPNRSSSPNSFVEEPIGPVQPQDILRQTGSGRTQQIQRIINQAAPFYHPLTANDPSLSSP